MYVYIRSEPSLWTVGFYDPSGRWHPDSDHDSPVLAANRVAWLNGSSQQTAATSNNSSSSAPYCGYCHHHHYGYQDHYLA